MLYETNQTMLEIVELILSKISKRKEKTSVAKITCMEINDLERSSRTNLFPTNVHKFQLLINPDDTQPHPLFPRSLSTLSQRKILGLSRSLHALLQYQTIIIMIIFFEFVKFECKV